MVPLRHFLLQRHGTITEYDSSGRTRHLAAFDALAPEHQHSRQHDEDDAAENSSDDRSDIVAMMASVLGRELRLGRRETWDRGSCCRRSRKWGECSWMAGGHFGTIYCPFFVRIDSATISVLILTSDLIRQDGIPGSFLLYETDHYAVTLWFVPDADLRSHREKPMLAPSSHSGSCLRT